MSNVTKICNVCEEEKLIEDFYFFKKDNKYSHCCKKCKIEQVKSYPYKPKDKKKEQARYQKFRYKTAFRKYIQFDKERGLDNNLTLEFVQEASKQKCIYCGFSSVGLDRKDNTLGHTIENCVPACKECNIARMNNFSHKETFILGQAIRKIKLSRVENLSPFSF